MEEDDLGADPDPDIMTSAEFREFANWASGPDGLPTLKLLALVTSLMKAGSMFTINSSADTHGQFET
jgi:hypothetical protein